MSERLTAARRDYDRIRFCQADETIYKGERPTEEDADAAFDRLRAAILAEHDEATLRAIDDYWKGYEAQLAVLRRRIENLEEMRPDED